ncbi:MAG: hypothetical protein HQM02_07285 [Magnetococcales bacterium]|nr:hypothetical protein [Magnetococcales bacterium]
MNGFGDPHNEILHDLLLSMGKLQGNMEAIQLQQQNQTGWMAKLDDRLRRVERKAAVTGMIGGGLMATGLSLLVDLLKSRSLPGG